MNDSQRTLRIIGNMGKYSEI